MHRDCHDRYVSLTNLTKQADAGAETMTCQECGGRGQIEIIESNGHWVECPTCSAALKEDLAMLVRRFIHITRQGGPLGNTTPIIGLRAQALGFLQRKGLAGSILRDEPEWMRE